jgi:hypothetical protein
MTFDLHEYPLDSETPTIETMYVSEVVDVPFPAAADSLAALSGRTISAGADRLEIAGTTVDSPAAPFQRVSAVLHVHAILPRKVHVDVELTPWSEARTEVGISPTGRHFTMLPVHATKRYLRAARAVAAELASALTSAGLAATA